MMCLGSAEWRALMREQFRKCIDLGADGALNDEIQHFRVWHFCFDKSHGHEYPGYIDSGACRLADELSALAAKEHEGPEPFLLAGEGQSDLIKRTHGLSYFRVFEGHVPVERYIDPAFPLMVSVVGFDDRESVNACLLYRYIMSYEPFDFRGELEDFPLTLEYGKKVDELRRRYREFLWDGEFRDTLGARVEVRGGLRCLYSVFKSAKSKRRAVVIANYNATDIDARVEWDAPVPGSGLDAVSPEEPEPRRCDGSVKIPPRSVIVVMET